MGYCLSLSHNRISTDEHENIPTTTAFTAFTCLYYLQHRGPRPGRRSHSVPPLRQVNVVDAPLMPPTEELLEKQNLEKERQRQIDELRSATKPKDDGRLRKDGMHHHDDHNHYYNCY